MPNRWKGFTIICYSNCHFSFFIIVQGVSQKRQYYNKQIFQIWVWVNRGLIKRKFLKNPSRNSDHYCNLLFYCLFEWRQFPFDWSKKHQRLWIVWIPSFVWHRYTMGPLQHACICVYLSISDSELKGKAVVFIIKFVKVILKIKSVNF